MKLRSSESRSAAVRCSRPPISKDGAHHISSAPRHAQPSGQASRDLDVAVHRHRGPGHAACGIVVASTGKACPNSSSRLKGIAARSSKQEVLEVWNLCQWCSSLCEEAGNLALIQLHQRDGYSRTLCSGSLPHHYTLARAEAAVVEIYTFLDLSLARKECSALPQHFCALGLISTRDGTDSYFSATRSPHTGRLCCAQSPRGADMKMVRV
ncbi:uncharacterized protein MYCFIDRAFT_170949 [Pseudocercospora fijiensis CIRAD86]|uniref:Uncharacterized protein n=1 Tax=Pseudocercospora fijiensis (strain CIRAD86) TaxID=383855 RepID=N1QCL2_PSEFD|nr:uncharacterized protein MYCFIDRAFT_170949 [Pseudocercospora fijiensis CIRAD86]EME89492.1 hypothetical protein MYCFIDRAFT_170949 [Pseudocercospora fijiensis CIRAD86]